MEYRKNWNSPMDMVDDDMITKILDESDDSIGQYGRMSNRRRSNSCGCRNRNMNNHPTPYQMPRQEKYPQHNENFSSDSDCGCGCEEKEMCEVSTSLSGKHLAMAYHPDHEFDGMFDVDEALSHGTLFRGLEFPFYPACESCR